MKNAWLDFLFLIFLSFGFYGGIYPWIKQKMTKKGILLSKVVFWVLLAAGTVKASLSLSKGILLVVAVLLYESEAEINPMKKRWEKISAYAGLAVFLVFLFLRW